MSVTRYSHPTKSTAPAWTIPTRNFKEAKKLNVPGPGAYDYSEESKSGARKFDVSGRDAVSIPSWDTPGPGYYRNE
jgi:hypothetical protein